MSYLFERSLPFRDTSDGSDVIIVSTEGNSSYCTTSIQLGCWANYLRFASSPAGYDVWKSGLSAKKLDWIYFCCTFNLCNLSENDLFIPEKFQVHPCPWNSLKFCRLLLKNLWIEIIHMCNLIPHHTTYSRNNMRQKCGGDCDLWVLNEII